MNLARAFSNDTIPGVSPEVYSAADFKAIAGLVHADAGIVLPVGKSMLVYSRIAPLVRESASSNFKGFIEEVRGDAVLRKRMVEALTTNHTFFFREAHHFLHLAETVRPALVRLLEEGGEARIWSAGCSSGEETWSLILTLLGEDLEDGRRLSRRKVKVLASDLAPKVLRRAEAGRYTEAEIKDVPFALRQNWLKAEGAEVSIGPEARTMVRFRELNLLGDWPMVRPFEVIFCRNVMIYFDQPTKEQLLDRLAQRLRPGGFLYIGHSERVTGPAERLLEPVGPTTYRRRPV